MTHPRPAYEGLTYLAMSEPESDLRGVHDDLVHENPTRLTRTRVPFREGLGVGGVDSDISNGRAPNVDGEKSPPRD